MAAAGATMLATPALACDDYETLGGGWAQVVQAGDTNIYWFMASEDYAATQGWSARSKGYVAASRICGASGTVADPSNEGYPHLGDARHLGNGIYGGYIVVQ